MSFASSLIAAAWPYEQSAAYPIGARVLYQDDPEAVWPEPSLAETVEQMSADSGCRGGRSVGGDC